MGLFAAVLIGVASLAWWKIRPEARPTVASLADLPLPLLSPTHYQNAGPQAQYIGSDACATCHQANHQSYRLTAHSKALADLDPAAEPPDAAFHHQPSGRDYRIYRKDGKLWHQEVLKAADGTEVAHVDRPVRYVIGSGHFTRSYLVEQDGFLFESPLTWYMSKQAWGMSPGYDLPRNMTFERPMDIGCLGCHMGRAEQARDSTRVTFHEKAIGCESCHGPGSLHAARQKNNTPSADPSRSEDDLTIVHPGKLPRERLEAVCANCHLGVAISVPPRGRTPTDFRPGMPLSDYRLDYVFDAGGEQMTVVGHIEQLRRSTCYQKSDLTCITCHNPHEKETPKDPVAFYRQKCLDCHAKAPCKLEPAVRLKKEPADNCTACHMQRGDTDIPHIAFTHHRISRHPPSPAQHGSNGAPNLPDRTPTLVPAEDQLRYSDADQKRNLGLAYIWLSDLQQYTKYADEFRARGKELLEPLHAAGMPDPLISVALANAWWQIDPPRAGRYAQEALDAADLPPDFRAGALVVRADCYLKSDQPAQAVPLLEQLVRLRRRTEDWRLLGRLYLDGGEPRKAVAALNEALSLRPYRYDIHGALAEAYRRLGDGPRAREHLEKAQWLQRNGQE